MLRKLLCFVIIGLIGSSSVIANSGEPNICNTTHVGHCYEDVEWQVGWFWANLPPSSSSCALYHLRFTMGDFWGMCNGINQKSEDDANGSYSEADSDPQFLRTSRWHPLPEDWSTACPWEGLDPIIDYEENTFICATDF